MKNTGKSSKPIIAAHSTKQNGEEPAPPEHAKRSGAQARVSRVSNDRNTMRQLVLERISDGLLAFDAAMNHVYVDERAGELLGREPGELLGKNFWQEYPDSNATPFGNACQRAFDTQTVVPFDGYFPPSNTWFEGRVYPSSDGLSVLISEHRQPENEEMIRSLEKSDEKFSKAFHSSPIAKAITRASDMYFIDINQSLLDLFGFDHNEVVGRTVAEIGIHVSPAWREVLLQLLQKDGRIHGQEMDIQVRSGEVRYIILSIEPIEIEGEACLLISAMDITERKRAEEKIHEISEFPMQNPNPVMRITRAGELLFANPAAASLLDFTGQPTGAAIPAALQKLLPVVEAGTQKEIELEINEKTFNCLSFPVTGTDYVNLYLTDITERLQAQESLQALVEQTTTGIIRTDLEGRLLFVNQAFCDMVGHSETELIGSTIWDLNHPDETEKNKRLFKRMADGGEPYRLETRILRRNGSVLWVNQGTSPLREAAGRPRTAVSVIVDITRRKRAEEALVESARRTLYLATLSDVLRSLSNPSQMEKDAARTLGTHLKTSRVAYAHITEDGTATVRDDYVDGMPGMTGEFNLRRYIPEDRLAKFNAGRVFVTSGTGSVPMNGEPPTTFSDVEPVGAQIVVPLFKEDTLVAALIVQQGQEREWSPEEINLVEETAERMQSAIERARAERGLRESEKRFRILANTVPSMVWSTTPQGVATYFNDHWYSYTGLTPEQSIANWAGLTLHPDDYDLCQSTWKHCLATGSEYLLELRYRRDDGEYRWFQGHANPAFDENGNITGWHGVSTDIHDRVAREAELQDIINRTPFMLARCTRDLRYQFVSQAYARMLGHTPEELAGMSLAETLGEQGYTRISPHVEQVLQGRRVEFELEIPLKGAGMRSLHAVYLPDYNQQGEVSGWLASILDITERKQMENALRDSEQKFSLIYEKLPFAAALSRPEGGVLTDVNEEFERVFGVSKQDAIGRTSSELGINPDSKNRQRLLEKMQANGSAHDMEIELVTRSMGARTFLMNMDTVMIAGERYIFQTVQDITERKQMEESLRSSEERFAKAFRASPEAIIISQLADGVILEVNKSWNDLLGYDESEVIGRSSMALNLFAHVEDRARAIGLLQQQGYVHNFELDIRRQSGEIRHVSLSAEKIEIQGVDCLLTILNDVTENRRMQQALKQEQELQARIFELIPVMITVYDPAVRLTNINPEFERVSGWKKEEIAQISIMEECYPDPLYRTQVQQFVDACEPGKWMDIQMRTRDGHMVETSWSNIRMSNEVQVGIGLDISGRKRYERTLIEYLRRQTALYMLADQLHRANTLQGVLNASLDAILNALQCDRASILLYDENQVMRFVSWRGLSDDYRKATDGHSPWTPDEKNATPIYYNDIENTDLGDALKDVIRKEGISALAFIPLVFNGRLIGKFMVYFNEPHGFNEDELNLGLTIAYQLALAVGRKRDELALRESQQRLALTYYQAPIGIIETSPEGRFLDVNAEFCKMMGYTHDELLTLSMRDVTYKDDLDQDLLLYRQLIDGRMPYYRSEKRYVTKSGSLIWAEIVRTVILDEAGKTLYGITAVVDSTERKQREETLRARTEEIETLMEVSPIGIFVAHDPECARITGNPAGNRLVGIPEESYRNVSKSAPEEERPAYRVFRHGRELEAYELPMQAAARLGMEIEEEALELRFENGVQKYLYAYAKPLFDSEGRTRGAIAAMVDITGSKRAEQALRESNQRYETLVQISPYAILINRNNKITFINSQGLKLFGADSHEQVLDRPIFEFLHPDERERIHQRISSMIDNQGQVAPIHTKLVRFDGQVIEVESTASFFSDNGEPAILVTMNDITKRLRAEQEIRLNATIVENVSAGIYMVRASDGTIIHSNPKFDSMFGYEPGELNGKHISTINAPTDRSAKEVAEQVMTRLRETGSWQGEVHSLRKDGSRFWCFATVNTFEHAIHGTVWVAARQDIDENIRREQQVAEQARLLDLSNDAIFVRDLEHRITYWNQGAQQVYGWAGSEVLGKPGHSVLQTEFPEPLETIMDALYRERQWSGELRQVRRDGVQIITLSRWTLNVDKQGTPLSILEANNDITERKREEDRLMLLAEISDLMRKSEDSNELMSAAAQRLGKHMQVQRCVFGELDLENDVQIIHGDYHDGTESLPGALRISDFSRSTFNELMPGKTIVNTDSMKDPRTAKDYKRSYKPIGVRAYISVPMLRDGHVVAVLAVSDDHPRVWSREDVSLLEAVAERIWTATEKLRIHTALRDSEERLRVTFNTTVVGFATLDLDTRFVDANQAYCDIVGYTREELLEMTCDKLTHPDYIEPAKASIAQLLAGNIPFFVIEEIFIRRDGGEIWVQNSVSLLRGAQGRPLHLIVISQDITERKRTDNELHELNLELENRVQSRTSELQAAYEFLRESEATSRLILESMPDAIVVANPDGNIVYANSQVETLFGYAPREIMGQSVEMLIPRRFHEPHQEHRLRYNQKRERRSMGVGRELYGQRKDGSEFPVDVMLSPISNSTTWDVMITIRDNSEQKQAQEAIRTNEEKLRKLFEILPVGISFLDSDGKVVQMNNTLTQIIGYSKHELLEGRFKKRQYIHADGTPMPQSEFASAQAHREQKAVYNVETGIVKENGEIVWTSVNAAPVDVAGVDMVVATIDITERKSAEEALHRHRERLKVLSRRLVEVQEEERRTLAHELHDRVGQNLAALNLNLNILRSQLSSDSLKVIGTRIDDSVSLVNQILTITRSVMSDLRSNVLDDYGLEAALREFADRFMQRTGVQVFSSKPGQAIPRLDPSVEMTLLRIAQEALTNVSRHAQADVVNISIDVDNETVNMSIEDNGIGILSWQKANQPGSHGLRIIRERAEAFGGSLLVHSAYKKGTRIEVKIPLGNSSPSYKVSREKRT